MTTKDLEECIKEALSGNTASELLQHTLKMSDQEREVLYCQAYDLYQANRIEEAKAHFTYLTALNPLIQKHWMALSACDICLQAWEEALPRLAIASLLEPDDPTAHYQAYLCYSQLHNNTEAQIALKQAASLARRQPQYSHLRQEIEKHLQVKLW